MLYSKLVAWMIKPAICKECVFLREVSRSLRRDIDRRALNASWTHPGDLPKQWQDPVASLRGKTRFADGAQCICTTNVPNSGAPVPRVMLPLPLTSVFLGSSIIWTENAPPTTHWVTWFVTGANLHPSSLVPQQEAPNTTPCHFHTAD